MSRKTLKGAKSAGQERRARREKTAEESAPRERSGRRIGGKLSGFRSSFCERARNM